MRFCDLILSCVRVQRPPTKDSSIVKRFRSAKSLIFSGLEAFNRPRPTRPRAGDPRAKTRAILGRTAQGPASALLGSCALYRPTDQPSDRAMDRFGFGRMGNYSLIGCVAPACTWSAVQRSSMILEGIRRAIGRL